MLLALLLLLIIFLGASWLVEGFVILPIDTLALLGHPEVWLGAVLLFGLAWCYGD